MSNKIKNSEITIANCIYWGMQLLSILLWFILWWLLIGFGRLQLGFRWYVPLFLFAVMESMGIVIEVFKTNSDDKHLEYESTSIKHIEDNVEKIVTAIAILAAIPAFFLGRGNIPLPTEFFSLVFVAFVAILGGTLSWFGVINKHSSPIMVILIRQIKAESYRHSLTWTLAAIISLYEWITVNI